MSTCIVQGRSREKQGIEIREADKDTRVKRKRQEPTLFTIHGESIFILMYGEAKCFEEGRS